ncbi:hypothetical protein [Absidia glauca]|uniref:F-box domain-containing protein n=1 Tax=Absidia glauca TaxID=4829 RepID=A0A168SV67_ABSGL|nr:hypothetical protein [Absidia glauca]
MTHLWQFPLEVVKLIVAHIDTHKDLYQWALVSKRFHIIVTPQLWHAPLGNQSLIFGTAYSLLDCLRLGHDRQLGHHIRKLKFGRSDVLQYVIQLLGHTPLLEELSLRRLAVRKQDIQWITQHCPRLQLLQLWATYITNDTIGSLGDLCYLHHLELVSCTRLTAQALRTVEHCPLTTLLLHDCTLAIDHHSAIYIQRLTQLTRLELTTPYGGTTRKFMNHLFPPTTTVLPLLQHFFINGSPDDPIDDSVLVPFIKSHPLLTDLTIANCRITQTTLAALGTHLPRLLRLDISSTGGAPLPFPDVRGLIQTCAHLVMLRLNRTDLDPQSFAGLEYSFKWVRAELHAVDLERIRSA